MDLLVGIRNYHINQLYQAWFFLPAIQLKYNIGPTHHIFLNYLRVIDYANVDYLNDNSFIDNFRTIKEPSSLNFSSPYIQNIYSLNYLNLDLYNGLVIFFNSIYTEYETRISNNTQLENNIIKTTNINLTNQFSWVNQITLEYRLLGLKNKLKLSANHIQSNFKNETNSKLNTQLIQSYGSKCSVLSSFKSEIFNYEIGYRFNMQSTKFSVFNSVNSLLTQNLFFNFNGSLNEKWSYILENLLERYKSEDLTTQFNNLNFKIVKKNKKIKYWLEGNNILNLNNQKIINIYNKNNFIATDIVNRLAGYLGLGLGYNF